MTDWDANALPGSLREISEVVGLPAAVRLVEGWGGLRLYVPEPEHVTAEHPLAQHLGRDTARQLAGVYAREKLDIPRCLAAVRAARDRRIHLDHDEGVSARRLAIRYQLTERQIWAILARARNNEPDRHGDLFA